MRGVELAGETMAADVASPPCGTVASAMSPSSDLPSTESPITNNNSNGSYGSKRQRRPAGTPDPDAEVVVLSPHTLMESDRYVCDICSQGFQRDQNLQMHRRRHKVPWKLLKRPTADTRKRVYVCPEPTCLHHDPGHALGDLVGIKKHFRRKHSAEKQWKCDKCSKGYAVQSDYKAHLKTCGTRGHCCDCGRVFSRVESFIEHQDSCGAVKEKAIHGAGGITSTMNCPVNKLSDNPSSPSTDEISVNPSLSAISEGAAGSFDQESTPHPPSDYELPAATSSPSSKRHWRTFLEDRELQLLPKKAFLHNSSRAFVSISDGQDTMETSSSQAVSVCKKSMTSINSRSTSSPQLRSQFSRDDVTPQLQLSIGPYTAADCTVNLGEMRETSGRSLPVSGIVDVLLTMETKSEGRQPFTHLHKLHNFGDSASSLTQDYARAHAVHPGSSCSKSCDREIGQKFGLSTTSPLPGLDNVREREVHFQEASNEAFLLKNAGVKLNESSLFQRRKNRSPNDEANSLLVAQENSCIAMQSDQHPGRLAVDRIGWMHDMNNTAVLTPTTPGSTCASEPESPGTIRCRRQIEAVARAREDASRNKEIGSHTMELVRSEIERPWSSCATTHLIMDRARKEREDAESDLAQAEQLKHKAREQLKLASAEKIFAEHAHESAKRQRELAEADLASAKRVREHAQSELSKAQLLKEHADRCMDAASARFNSSVSSPSSASSLSPTPAKPRSRHPSPIPNYGLPNFSVPNFVPNFHHPSSPHLHPIPQFRFSNGVSSTPYSELLRAPKSENFM